MKQITRYLIILVLSGSIFVNMQAADRYSVSSGNWNSTTIWSATSGGAPGASVPVAGDIVYIENNHTINVTADAGCQAIIITGNGANVDVGTGFTLTITDSFTLNNLSTSSNSCTISGGGAIQCNNVQVGSVTNTPSGNEDIFNHIIYSTISTLYISGNLNLNSYYAGFKTAGNAGFYLEEGTLTTDGTITANNERNQNTSTFSMESGNESGTLYLNGTTPFSLHRVRDNLLLNGASSMVVYSATGAQTLANSVYNNLTLSGSGTKTSSPPGSVTVNGMMSMEGTALMTSNTLTYGPNSSLRYKGDLAQTTGDEFPLTFPGSGGLIIDNLNGVTLNETKTITYSIIFINGIISTGSFTLTLSNNGIVTGAGDGNYVNGIFEKGIAASTTSINYEVGDATSYTPVSIAFSGTTNATGFISVSTTSGDHPLIGTSSFSPSYTVNRYWTIANNGVTGFTSYDATFNYLSSDLDPDTDPYSLVSGLYTGGTWTYPANGTSTLTSLQATGLIAFGDFQPGVYVGTFRSAASGNWNQVSTWEVFVGGVWTIAPAVPSAGANTVTIISPHNVSLTSDITIDELTVEAGGILTLADSLELNDGTGTDLSVAGTIICSGLNIVYGTGSFILSSAAGIEIGNPDGIDITGLSGSIQTGTSSFDQGANYTYSGSLAQVTGSGLPSIVNNLTINNTSGVSLSSSVTLNGTLYLTSGVLNTGTGSLTFQNSDIPISRTAGTISLSSSSSLTFGTAGNTGGAAFTIPAATFTSDQIITDFTINRSNSLTLNEQMLNVSGVVLCNGPLNTSGNLTLLSDAAGTALIDGSGAGTISGNVLMQRYLPVGFGYKYISSPFQSASVSELADDIDLAFWYPILFKYDESRTSSGWLAHNNPADPLTPLTGYAANFGSSIAADTFDISGVVNNGPLSITLFNNNNLYTQGMNLVGNPYPSAIDWDAASGWTKTNIDNAIYFFKASSTDQYGGTYSSYIAGISSDGLVSGIIPSMQGFFVHVSDGAYPVTATLGVNNNVRISDKTQSYSKSKSAKTKSALYSLIRLSAGFSDDEKSADQAVIYLHPFASSEYDFDTDALKLLNTDFSIANIYSLLDDGRKLSINSLPENIEFPVRIALGLKINRPGNTVIKLNSVDTYFENKDIWLYDAETATNKKLTPGDSYTVNLASGEYHQRFFLDINPLATSVAETESDLNLFSVSQAGDALRVNIFKPPSPGAGISIMNLVGQLLRKENVTREGIHEYSTPASEGIYLITYKSGSLVSTRKIFIRR